MCFHVGLCSLFVLLKNFLQLRKQNICILFYLQPSLILLGYKKNIFNFCLLIFNYFLFSIEKSIIKIVGLFEKYINFCFLFLLLLKKKKIVKKLLGYTEKVFNFAFLLLIENSNKVYWIIWKIFLILIFLFLIKKSIIKFVGLFEKYFNFFFFI